MIGGILLFIAAVQLSTLQQHNNTNDDVYYELPRFWANTGFCPAGKINRKDITTNLLSDAVQMNLRYLAALPEGAVSHLRVHWLLESIEFVSYTQAGVPIYDFTNLDTFLMNLDEMSAGTLYPVIEFMGNPGDVFAKNPNRNDFLWEDFSYQVAKHYLNMLGAAKLLRWRFESWNEPDLHAYNTLNFTVEDYFIYLAALRRGLNAAGRRPVNPLHFPLRGPAGLFKLREKHPLCWGILEQCNANVKHCPFEILSYHRKGTDGTAGEVLHASRLLLQNIYQQFPALGTFPITNDEADPIAGWSTPQDFHEDVRYAVILISIVFDHWSAKIQRKEFEHLESISHDNAFLSYHPYEFSQRTLLAHFRMNNTNTPYSQFIQKPVYAALGMLSKLGPLAANVEEILAASPTNGQPQKMSLLKTTVPNKQPLFLSWILVPSENASDFHNFTLQRKLPFELCAQETFAYIIEILEQQCTDPAYIWRSLISSNPYPTAAQREVMRRSQTPKLHATGILKEAQARINVGDFKLPWVIHLRVCSNLISPLKQPAHLVVANVTHGEILLTWREVFNSTVCLKTYEVWFQVNSNSKWTCISIGWHLPFPSFQFAPADGNVNGFYKVRGVDIFNIRSKFSESVEYIEL